MKVRIRLKTSDAELLKLMLTNIGGASNSALTAGRKRSDKKESFRNIFLTEHDYQVLRQVPYHEFYSTLGIEADPLNYGIDFLSLICSRAIRRDPDQLINRKIYLTFLQQLEKDEAGAGKMNTSSLISYLLNNLNSEINYHDYLIEESED